MQQLVSLQNFATPASPRAREMMFITATALVFGALAFSCFIAWPKQGPMSAIWIPNAIAAAFLLQSAPNLSNVTRNTLIVLAITTASLAAHALADFPIHLATLFALSDALEIAIAVILTRHWCKGPPDMVDIGHLGCLAVTAFLIAPAVSGLIAMIGIGSDITLSGWFAWFIAHTLGMIILVPAILWGGRISRNMFAFSDKQMAKKLDEQQEHISALTQQVADRVELESLLRNARRDAENATHAKSEFLASMSHEIRTPMNSVLGFAELMLQSDLNQEQRRQIELIVQSGHSMLLLLNDILDLSKIEAGQIEIDYHTVHIGELINDCIQLHRSTAEHKGISFHTDLPACVPVIVSDGQRLRQIMLNLIGNAVKFTGHGKITIGCEQTDDVVRITVRDTGIGIDPKHLKGIFLPFAQAETDTTRRYGGTGLGLSISSQLAELLDGYIEVDSDLDKGACFTLTLPFVEADELSPETASIDAAEEPVEHESTHNELRRQTDRLPPSSHILLVEDHEINRLLVRTMLERCGQRVSIAENGHQAITKVLEAQLHNELYDLVLMDIQMPGCDGYEATRAIRHEGIRSETMPIIALSANAFPEDIKTSLKSGMQAHIAKPLIFSDLVQALQRWLPVRIVDDGLEAAEIQSYLPHDSDAETHLETKRKTHREPHAQQVCQDALEQEFTKILASSHHVPSQHLQIQWQQRRREALATINTALRDSKLTGLDGDELAMLVHKLAGTAGLFGEEDLGERAAAFERALRSNVNMEVREQLARDLLEAA